MFNVLGGQEPCVKIIGDLSTPLNPLRLDSQCRVPGLLCGVVCVIVRLAILIQCRLVTDRQTDRRTHGHSIYRVSVASRVKIDATKESSKVVCAHVK